MAVNHVLLPDRREDRVQTCGAVGHPLGEAGEVLRERCDRHRTVRASAPQGIAAALGTLQLDHLLKDIALAHGPVKPAGGLAHGSLMSLRQQHPFGPFQHGLAVLPAATQLATDQLTALATAIETDVVLVEIRGAGHHDQGARLLRWIGTTGRRHQSFDRPRRTIRQPLHLLRPARRQRSQHPAEQ